jgi:hypothetical protein
MTEQEIFDTVATHLLTQGKRAGVYGDPDKDQNPTKFFCQYRAPDNCKCAVGCLIPDNQYIPDMEGQNCEGSKVQYVLRVCGLKDHVLLLGSLQNIHDCDYGCYPGELEVDVVDLADRNDIDWKNVFRTRLQGFAKRFPLSSAVLDQIP